MGKKEKNIKPAKRVSEKTVDTTPAESTAEAREEALPLHIYILNNLRQNAVVISMVIAVFFLLGLLYVYTNKFSPQSFIGKEFSSTRETEQEMTISDDSTLNGVFTYGPYIDIKKGDYKITVEYRSDTDIDFQVSSNYGANNIVTVALPKDETKYTFDAHIGNDVTDKSLELRSFYKGHGTFTLERVTIEGGSGGSADIPYIGVFALCAALCIFFFNRFEEIILLFYINIKFQLFHK